MTKIINLDELGSPERAVTHKGVKYHIEDLSIRDFIIANEQVDKINKSFQSGDYTALVEQAEVVIKLACPTFPVDDLQKLNLSKVSALIGLIMNSYPADADAPSLSDGASGNA